MANIYLEKKQYNLTIPYGDFNIIIGTSDGITVITISQTTGEGRGGEIAFKFVGLTEFIDGLRMIRDAEKEK